MSAITIIGDHAPLAKIGEHSVHMFKAGVLLGAEETSLTRDHLLIGPTKEPTTPTTPTTTTTTRYPWTSARPRAASAPA